MLLPGAAALVFLAAAGRDLGWRLIDHRLIVSLLLLWVGHVVLSGWAWEEILAHMGVGAIAILVTVALYSLGWMGGGDVKLATAVFVWAGPENGPGVLVLVTLAGAVLAILGLAARGCLRLSLPAWVKRALNLFSTDRGVPYGVALAFGGALAALSAPAGAG